MGLIADKFSPRARFPASEYKLGATPTCHALYRSAGNTSLNGSVSPGCLSLEEGFPAPVGERPPDPKPRGWVSRDQPPCSSRSGCERALDSSPGHLLLKIMSSCSPLLLLAW